MIPHIVIGKGSLERLKAECIALPIVQGNLETDPALDQLSRAAGGELKALARTAEFNGRADQVFECTSLGRLPQQRILLVGIGAGGDETGSEARYRNFAAVAVRHAANGINPQKNPRLRGSRGFLEKSFGLRLEDLLHVAAGLMAGAQHALANYGPGAPAAQIVRTH